MATALKLRSDISKLKKALQTKGLKPKTIATLETQLQKAEAELAQLKSTGKAPKQSSVKGTAKAFTQLQALIQKKKYSAYQGKGVDLKKDAGEGAFKVGRRVSKGLKANQYGSKSDNKGKVYYEYRVNRYDVKQPKQKQSYPKLADGGEMARGGMTKINLGDFETDDYGYAYYHGYVMVGDKRKDFLVSINPNDVISLNWQDVGYIGSTELNKAIIEKAKRELGMFEDGGEMARGGIIQAEKLQIETIKNLEETIENLKGISIHKNTYQEDDNYKKKYNSFFTKINRSSEVIRQEIIDFRKERNNYEYGGDILKNGGITSNKHKLG